MGSTLEVSISIKWSMAPDNRIINDILQDCLTAVEGYTESHGVCNPVVSLNDAHASQNPMLSNGHESFGRRKAATTLTTLMTQIRFSRPLFLVDDVKSGVAVLDTPATACQRGEQVRSYVISTIIMANQRLDQVP
ncbi:hypothetical protein GGR54DRAFT_50781 [Hypoxylon sp. NC1633]|nr:hypothetical protein GGR54DRAFT_50781 [Hypoxylon sp. NC1633]